LGISTDYWSSTSGRTIWPYIKNSAIECLLSTIVVMLLAVPGAYGLSRWKSRISNIIFLSYFVLRMIPPITLLTPRIYMITNLHLIDSFIGLALIYIPNNILVAVWLMRGFFDLTPKELEEYAYVEGATYFQTFFKIVLPININGIAVTSVFVFIYCYIEYMYASLITRSLTKTVPPFIAEFINPFEIKYQLMLSTALVSILPMILLYAFAQRYIVKGITAGAIK
jgi:multiple sugar transport system permease protein